MIQLVNQKKSAKKYMRRSERNSGIEFNCKKKNKKKLFIF